MVLILFLFALLLLSALPVWSNVYKCTDPQGKVHFRDAPCTGNDEMPLVITMPSTAPPPITTPPPAAPLPEDEKPKQTVKSCLLISKLEDQRLSHNSVYTEVAWLVEVSNLCWRPFRIHVVFSLLDRQDFSLDEGRASIVVPSMGEGIARGRLLVSPPGKMQRVDRTHAHIAEY